MVPRRLAFIMFGVVLCVYITTTGGSFATDLASYEVTKSLVQHGTVAMSYNVLATEAERGVDGRYYAPVGIGHPLFGVPFYLASRIVQSTLGVRVGKPETLDKAAVVVGSAVAAALCAPVAFLFAWRLTGNSWGALFAAFGLAFATSLWPYSKFGFNAPLAALCLLTGVYWVWLGARTERQGWIVLGGVMLGCALLTRHEMGVAALPLAAWLLVESNGRRDLVVRRMLMFGLPVATALGIWLIYNYVRFGHPLDTGLLRDPNIRFDTPLLVGLHGLIASPGRSLFLYSPLTLAGLVGLFALGRRDRSTAILFGTLVVTLLLVFAMLHQWDGGESYGPRYLVPTVAFLTIPVAALWPLPPRLPRALLAGLFTLSVGVQLPGVLVDFSKAQNAFANRTEGYSIQMSRYSWRATPLALNTKAALEVVPRNVRYVLGRESLPEVALSAEEDDRGFSQQFAFSLDFWWLYLFYLGAVPAGVAMVLAALPLAMAIWFARWTRTELHRASPGGDA